MTSNNFPLPKSVVLKFGGSVLHSHDDFARITHEIQQFVEAGTRVVAVVSAFFGVTEQLIQEAVASGLDAGNPEYASMIAMGEFQSAQELAGHLIAQNVSAKRVLPSDVGFIAAGERLSARPVSLSTESLAREFERASVLVLPGFSAVDQHGECVLLGRGGSDISAVCVANALDLPSVRLLKDVDGLYDKDPNKYSDAQRLTDVSYEVAKSIGCELIQPQAIDFAASRGIRIEIAAIGRASFSCIGARAQSAPLGSCEEMARSC